jgi:hypothetical protein
VWWDSKALDRSSRPSPGISLSKLQPLEVEGPQLPATPVFFSDLVYNMLLEAQSPGQWEPEEPVISPFRPR